MISIRVYPHTAANIKGVEDRSLGWLLHPLQSTDSSRVWVCQENGKSLLRTKCRERYIYTCLSAIMTTALSANQSQRKILMICDILLTCLSMYSIPFLKYLQHWHHPVQSNFSRHLCVNHNMYSYLNTTPSHYSIFYSSSFLTLLGCPLRLLFPYKDFKDSRSFCSPDKAVMEYSGCKLKADELKKKQTKQLLYFIS